MSAYQNRYRADLRDFQFVLFEQFKLENLLGKEPFQDWGRDEIEISIKEAYNFSTNVFGPLNPRGDREGCRIENGQVIPPEGFGDAWKKLYEAGWKSISLPTELGGQGAPRALYVIVEEMLDGSNPALSMYPGLTYGVSELVHSFATEEQKEKYLHKLCDGTFSGTMCLTEPQAGSDVGLARSKATRRSDGRFNISGTKIFISCGDQNFTDNIIHMVLARIEGAPAGTKGLSLFIVPKYRLNADGSRGEFNDVQVASIEHKMGLHGSATCVLSFGENADCIGELVGTQENVGIRQMFQLMNMARIATGIQGLAVGSSAYLNALEYTRTRKQGAAIEQWKDPNAPRVTIQKHADVRRMLLDMKSRVEGIRALIVKLAVHHDHTFVTQDEQRAYHQGQIDLLVPLVKAYGSDQAFRVGETAIQTLGGVGYTRDYPIEQCVRDAKVFSIYEGTNHIQAMDLVARKLPQDGGQPFQALMQDIGNFVAANAEHAVLKSAVARLSAASEALTATAMRIFGWSMEGRISMVPVVANRFLEMMSETTVGWLLLEAAAISCKTLETLSAEHADRAFYEGKKQAAIYFAQNVLPEVEAKATIISYEDESVYNISDEAFATV